MGTFESSCSLLPARYSTEGLEESRTAHKWTSQVQPDMAGSSIEVGV